MEKEEMLEEMETWKEGTEAEREREREESKVMYERPKSANCESDFFLYI